MLPKIINKWLSNVQLSPRGQKLPNFVLQPESSKYQIKRFRSQSLSLTASGSEPLFGHPYPVENLLFRRISNGKPDSDHL